MDEINLEDLKAKVNIVEYIGQYVELTLESKEWWGACPFHDEKTPSFNVNEEKGTYFCFGCRCGGSVIDFASSYHKLSFPKAVEMLAKEFKVTRNHIPSIMRVAKRFKPKCNDTPTHATIEYICNPMEKFEKEPIIEWLDEGIDQGVLDKYEVRYNKRDNRIVYPIRDNDGNVISVKGRTLDKNFKEKKGFASRKYAYYTSIGTTYFFFGFYENRDAFESENAVVIFEGEKSVMKLESCGMFNCIASLTDALTDEQTDALIKSSCRDVIIAWDKGVSLSHIKGQVKRLKKYKNVYYLTDTEGLLQEKDAPIDKGIEVFMHLYDNKERIV
jgi:DNA primase